MTQKSNQLGDGEGQIEMTSRIRTARCWAEAPAWYHCSLDRGHAGNHRAYRNHDQTTPLLDEWSNVPEAPPIAEVVTPCPNCGHPWQGYEFPHVCHPIKKVVQTEVVTKGETHQVAIPEDVSPAVKKAMERFNQKMRELGGETTDSSAAPTLREQAARAFNSWLRNMLTDEGGMAPEPPNVNEMEHIWTMGWINHAGLAAPKPDPPSPPTESMKDYFVGIESKALSTYNNTNNPDYLSEALEARIQLRKMGLKPVEAPNPSPQEFEEWWLDNVNTLRIEAEEADEDDGFYCARAAWNAARGQK